MIAKVTRAAGMRGVVRGLVAPVDGSGDGRDGIVPRLIGADSMVPLPLGTPLHEAKAPSLTLWLDTPRVLSGTDVGGGHVWRALLSTSGSVDRDLADREWLNVAESIVERLGFTGSPGVSPCRWLAVQRGKSLAGNDQLHLVVNLVREDGLPASIHNDFWMLRATCQEMEDLYGLTRTPTRSSGRGAASGQAGAGSAQSGGHRR